MARRTKEKSLETIINAARLWIERCLIEDGSVFTSSPLWTGQTIQELIPAFVENLDESDANFITKLKGQMLGASGPARKLMAEMLWAILLFPSKILPKTKRTQIKEIWELSGDPFPDNLPLLQDDVLRGIGSAGQAYNTHRWRELIFLINLAKQLKQEPAVKRTQIFANYDRFVEWIETVPEDGLRQFRHMLRFFAFPDRVERMSSNQERCAVLAGFGVAKENEAKNWSDRQLDEALSKLRQELEGKYHNEILDFYEFPLRERWKPTVAEQDELLANRRFWVEKTIVKARPDRQVGDNALGKALWSPQRSEDGKDIYRQMREVGPGDVVFHFVDNEALTSFSIAEAAADESFVGVPGTAWAGRTAYRIPLRDHQEIHPPISRAEFLQDARYKALMERLLADSRGLFFNRELNLNQGSYLTEAPLKLVQIWNDIHLRHADRPICEEWNIPALESVAQNSQPEPIMLFENEALERMREAIVASNFRVTPGFLGRFAASLLAKPFLILTGNSGTGKTKLAELFVQWLCCGVSNQFALVPIGADWSDNRNVLGFVNLLRTTKVSDGKEELDLPIYQTSKILDVLLEAGRNGNEAKPFFLILDEMNLSHVERYFADFLSTMESKEGRLLLHREGRPLPRSMGGHCDVPETLPLPKNVFVIGTVNIDETTYMFSPKVLDRANVIEFRVDEQAPKAFLDSGGQGIGEIEHAPIGYAESFLNLSFRARNISGAPLALVANPDVPPEGAAEGFEKCRITIADLFELMQKRHQEFAFRSMAEMLRYLAVSFELRPANEAWNWKDTMDAQILQKVLPKLHGSKRKIGSLLGALAKYCEFGSRVDAEVLLADETKAEAYLAAAESREKSPTFKGSYVKLCEMMEAVRRDQFVSFIQ